MTKTHTFITIPVLGALMLAGGGIAGYIGMAAADTSDTDRTTKARGMFKDGNHLGGEITAINGSTITVKDMRGDSIYTIETSGATFQKDGASASILSFAVGDRVMAEGTLSGTTFTATKVFGGMPKDGGPGGFGGPGGHGRGPGVMGEVTAVDGNTITVTGKDGTTYAVEAGSATVQKVATGSLSDIAVGDTIGVQGTVSGTNVTATTIMDDLPAKAPAQQ